MRITTTKEKILNAVVICERVVGKKESLPVLSCVLLEAGTKDLIIRSTNLEAAVEIHVPCEVEEKGIVAVPAGILSQTLRSTIGDKITFRNEDTNLLIESRGAKTLIKAIPHEEFPRIGDQKRKTMVTIAREAILAGLQAVLYAASPSMIRPELGSVCISSSPQGLLCVATDSFRLAEKKIQSSSKEFEVEILLPLKHATELSHILEHIDDEGIDIYADDTQLAVGGSGITYTSRIIDGTFPDYKQIIPKTFIAEATILKADFAEMLRKARVFSGDDQHVGFHVYPKKKVFSATARSSDIGEMSETIDAALSGEDIDINFHIGYIADSLSSIASDSIMLSFAGIGKPLVVRGVSDQSFTYLVMPLNR
jgi:DNA polymerase-3 subunit beta